MAKGKILRYPTRPPVPENVGGDDVESPTEFIDYISFRRYQIEYSDTKSGYYGLNLPNNDVDKKFADNRVYLSIPNAVQTSYQPQYNQVDLGVAGVAAAGLLGSGGNLDSLVDTIQSGAQAAQPEFAASAIAGAANNLGQMLGLAGNLDANSLQALTKGKVFNPFQEQIFKNMAFRTHNFNFKLFARNVDEAKEIYDIIQWMKIGAVPKIGGAGGFKADIGSEGGFAGEIAGSDGFAAASSSRFFEVPDKFEIKYKRLSPTAEFSSGGIELHHKIKDSVCAGINVNYTPDGSYNAFASVLGRSGGDGKNPFGQVAVPSLTLSMSFIETSIISLDDVISGY